MKFIKTTILITFIYLGSYPSVLIASEIYVAGYLDTDFSTIKILGYAPTLDLNGTIEIYYSGLPTGIILPKIDSDGLYYLDFPLDVQGMSGMYLLELIGYDVSHANTLHWPQLYVKADNTATPLPTPTSTPIQSSDFNMILVPAGTFMMGSPTSEACRVDDENLHEVTLTHPFYIQQTEVTQKQWLAIFGNTPISVCGLDCPVTVVTWYDSLIFCNRLSIVKGYTPCYYFDSNYNQVFDGTPPVRTGDVFWKKNADGYRLPTEAEWEYACRAGTNTPFSLLCLDYGMQNCFNPNCISRFAWYFMNSNGMQPVAQLEPNNWGLYDVHGNVCEWCWDRYAAYPTHPAIDPIGQPGKDLPVMRSGPHAMQASVLRSASRLSESNAREYIGFRLARSE